MKLGKYAIELPKRLHKLILFPTISKYISIYFADKLGKKVDKTITYTIYDYGLFIIIIKGE